MASVCLESVSKEFPGNVAAVRELSLEIRDRELLVLLGPSGCGKSTTLRLIAGLEEATSGVIRIGGRVVDDVAPKDRDIAMVFQNYALYPHMSVYKNMAFGLQLRYGGNWFHRTWQRLTSPTEAAEVAAKRRGIREQVRQTAQVLGIEPLLNRMPRQLSGGERQRVALGRAIVRHPAVFLFDEPLSNLDARLRLEMRRELSELHHQLDATMVYVTHDQTEAMTLGQRIAVMEHGELRQLGTPMEVYEQPADRFVAGFIGSPPMNFIDGELTRDSDRWVFKSRQLRITIPETKEDQFAAVEKQNEVVLGVRSEDVMLDAENGSQGDPNIGVVTVVEPLGDATLVYTSVDASHGSATFVSKMESRTRFERGARVKLRIDGSRVHLFDPTSGQNLTRV